jgi:hypothetical protein
MSVENQRKYLNKTKSIEMYHKLNLDEHLNYATIKGIHMKYGLRHQTIFVFAFVYLRFVLTYLPIHPQVT